MALFLLILTIFLTPINSYEHCITPNNKPGQCVLISHCPHLFSTILNQTTNFSKDHVQKSHCGFESTWFPKVCCPNEAVKLYENIHPSKHASKCGLHVPEGDTDPWMVLLEYEKNGNRAFLCGGVLIHKKYVLTAAHCIRGRNLPKNIKLVSVRFGEHNPDSFERPMSVQVDYSIVHENYNPDDPNHYNDIALIRLKKKVSFKNGMVRPICLPVNREDKIGNILPLAGWGTPGNESKSFTKKTGLATVWNRTECSLEYQTTRVRLGDSQICAGGKKRFRDDFGGVLMEMSNDTSYSIVGILAIRPSCCDKEEYPKVYTKISSYINWIFSNMD